MAKITRIHAYQTTDGLLIVDREKYMAHERNLAFGASVRGLVKAGVDKAYDDVDGSGNPGLMNDDEISQLILDNADALRVILSGKTKRTKRAKPAPAAQATSTTTTEAQQ